MAFEDYATLLPQESYGQIGTFAIVVGFLLLMYFFMYELIMM